MLTNPFDLTDDESYQRWRNEKMEFAQVSDAIVDIKNPHKISQSEKNAIIDSCDKNNYVIYQLLGEEHEDKSFVRDLGLQLGLSHLDSNLRADEDSVTSLEVKEQIGNQYIPYTDKPLSWHCDGYYNAPAHQIRGFIVHCASPAESGGETAIIDHEMLYIKLRDENLALIEALMQADAMTIPANIEGGVEIRAEQSGPVFSVDPLSGHLHMRYSARKRNILWKDNALTQQATVRITELLDDSSIIFRHRLKAGQGIVCNNVLHSRKSFKDSEKNKRLMYRARYYDRVSDVCDVK